MEGVTFQPQLVAKRSGFSLNVSRELSKDQRSLSQSRTKYDFESEKEVFQRLAKGAITLKSKKEDFVRSFIQMETKDLFKPKISNNEQSVERGRERALSIRSKTKRNKNKTQVHTPEKSLTKPANVFEMLQQDAKRRLIQKKSEKIRESETQTARARSKSKSTSSSVAKVVTNPRSSAVLCQRFLVEFDQLLLAYARLANLMYFDEQTSKVVGERESISKIEFRNLLRDSIKLCRF